MDNKNKRLLFWGGGHNDYFGNEVYALNLTGTPSLSRITDPYVPINDGTGTCSSPVTNAYPDGSPIASHTYDSIVEAPVAGGVFYMMPGRAIWPSGINALETFKLDTNTTPPTWTHLTTTGTNQPSTLGSTDVFSEAVYDPVRDLIFLFFNGSTWSFNYHTNAYVRINNSAGMNLFQPTCALDPVPRGTTQARWVVCVGEPYLSSTLTIQATDISGNDSTYTPQDWTTASAGTCANLSGGDATHYQGGPGWDYDSALGMFVGLPLQAGNTVYLFSDVTQKCVPQNFPGGPASGVISGSPASNGILGRWRYVTSMNVFAGINYSSQNAFILNLDLQIQGLGSSANLYTCIDRDGDGYGVGPGCTGPDSDDENAAVHTAAQASSAYGNLDALYQRRGYHPTRYWTIDPASGNDGTAASCTPAHFGTGTSDCLPFKTPAALVSALAAGDAAVFRAGTYAHPVTIVGGSSLTAEIYYLAYPGELPLFTPYPNFWTVLDQPYWVIDGIKYDGVGDTTQGTGCIYGGTSDANSSPTMHDWIIRNTECANELNGIYAFNGLANGLIETSVMHGMTGSHGIYLGSRAMVSSNIIIRRNLFYNNVRCGFQFNGRISDLHVEQNIAYQNAQVFNGGGGADYCFENGIHDSFLRGNVSLGSDFAVAISTNDGNEFGGTGSASSCGVSGTAHCTCNPGDSPPGPNQGSVCANNQFNIFSSNNTLVNTGTNVGGIDISIDPLVEVGRGGSLCTTSTCLGTSQPSNVWQNMIGLTKGQSNYAPQVTFTDGTTSPQSGPTNSLNGFVYLQTTGSTGAIGYGLQAGCCGYNPFTCATAVSGGHIASAAGCVNSNPTFVALGAYNNIGAYNLRLQPGSPAVGSAPAVVGTLPMDILGVALGSPANSGAFEGSFGANGGSSISGKATVSGKAVVH